MLKFILNNRQAKLQVFKKSNRSNTDNYRVSIFALIQRNNLVFKRVHYFHWPSLKYDNYMLSYITMIVWGQKYVGSRRFDYIAT